MKEIEIKSHLKNKQAVISKLEKLGCVLSAPIRQIDTVYTKIIGRVDEFLKNNHFVRIREKSDGSNVLTVKINKSRTKTADELVKIEHETEIEDAKEMESILFMMGYSISNKVVKIRQTAKYKEYEICLDDVEELGSFIEIEKMAQNDFADEHIILDELNSFMASLEISKTDTINKGYDVMMVEKLFS